MIGNRRRKGKRKDKIVTLCFIRIKKWNVVVSCHPERSRRSVHGLADFLLTHSFGVRLRSLAQDDSALVCILFFSFVTLLSFPVI